MAQKPPCQGCPPCCPKGCTWENSSAAPVKVAEIIVPAIDYGCIHGGAIVRTADGRVGIDRTGKTFTGFAPLTDSGAEFLRQNRPELASVLGI